MRLSLDLDLHRGRLKPAGASRFGNELQRQETKTAAERVGEATLGAAPLLTPSCMRACMQVWDDLKGFGFETSPGGTDVFVHREMSTEESTLRDPALTLSKAWMHVPVQW